MNDSNVGYWLCRTSDHLALFKTNPSKATREALLSVLAEFQAVVAKGLQIPRTLPDILRNARTMSEWHHRNLDEALAMFRIAPNAASLAVMDQHLASYQDAVAMGRAKPW
jgi:hypothetical protein